MNNNINLHITDTSENWDNYVSKVNFTDIPIWHVWMDDKNVEKNTIQSCDSLVVLMKNIWPYKHYFIFVMCLNEIKR